jgi:transcriptional regulator with XRE-family HTH domain
MIINPIKKRREEKGLTQAELALLLDITQIYISQYEIGGLVPSKKMIKKIVEILDLDKEIFVKDLSQFYQAKKKELKKQIKER